MTLLSKFQFLLASNRDNHNSYKDCGPHTNVEIVLFWFYRK